jgi:NADH-quinone oxidoreductase subunit M
MVYARAHTRELGELGGLGATAPRLTVAVVLAFLASMSVPGTAGFAAELLVVGGAWTRFGAWSLLPLAGAVVWAGTAVRVALSLAGGPRTAAGAHVTDLRSGEALALGLLGVAVVGLGLWPSLVIDLVDPGVRTLVSGLGASTVEVVRAAR